MARHGIDSAMTVDQLLRGRPAAATAFNRRGLACPGCGMAPFETLREVASVYGEDLAAFLADIAEAGRGRDDTGPEPERRPR